MKRPLLAILLVCQSCQSAMIFAPDIQPVSEVSFRVGNVRSAVDEKRISSLDVLIFRHETGLLETRVSGCADSLCARLPCGPVFDWVALANCPESIFDGVSSLKELMGRETKLEDVASSGGLCMMCGKGSDSFASGRQTVLVSMERYLSKITLSSLVPLFIRDCDSVEVFLAGAFLINVNGSEPLSGIPSVSEETWYNRMEKEDCGELNELLSIEDGRRIDSEGELVLGWSFYCCPNPVCLSEDVSVATSPEWSPRCTRLVVELSVGGVPNYYSTTVPSMRSNREYVISRAVLTGPGTFQPDRSAGNIETTYDVRVLKWEKETDDVKF